MKLKQTLKYLLSLSAFVETGQLCVCLLFAAHLIFERIYCTTFEFKSWKDWFSNDSTVAIFIDRSIYWFSTRELWKNRKNLRFAQATNPSSVVRVNKVFCPWRCSDHEFYCFLSGVSHNFFRRFYVWISKNFRQSKFLISWLKQFSWILKTLRC